MEKSLLFKVIEAVEQHYAERRASAPAQGALSQSSCLHHLVRWFLPNGGTLLLVAALVLTANAWARPLLSPASAPGPSATTVNYQGRLANTGGSPLTGTYGMTFALYDAPTGGALVWGPESHAAVPVSNGLFSAGLGSQTSGGIPTSVWNGDRYLEATVGGETLSPRELIRSVPIAGMALTVPDGAIGSRQMSPTFFQAAVSSDIQLPPGASGQVVLELPVTFPVAATYLIFVTCITRHDTDGMRIENYIRDESGNLIGWFFNSHPASGIGGTVTGATTVAHNFSAGAHTIRLAVENDSGATSGYVRNGTRIIAIPFAQVP